MVSLTGCFAVPKGEDDIRMVYDATKCGLNEHIWAPNFMLPTIDMTLRHVNENGWFGDIDLGEMFLNFPLDDLLRPFVGVDVTELQEELEKRGILPKDHRGRKGRIFLRWIRCLMGLKCSPYNASRAMGWAEDFIRGNRLASTNPLRWDAVILNLPGLKDYNPSLPKLYKWNDHVGQLAANFETYVDDIRTNGYSEHSGVLANRRVASRCNYLGIQDAARKRRFPSKKPGVWCGAKSSTDKDGVYTSTTQAKWNKGKGLIDSWLKELATSADGMLERKPLERGRGFLVHLSRTYPMLVPFMKGIHHTLETWRPGRNREGWKFTTGEWKLMLDELVETQAGKGWKELRADVLGKADAEAPTRVSPAGRLKRDLASLTLLFSSSKPPLRLVRGLILAYVLYGFGDASGAGFGSSWTGEEATGYRYGVWGKDNIGKSSNYRELRNLVESLEELGKKKSLSSTEIFFFTDNSTAENAFFKGSSTSSLLHELVTRLRLLEMQEGCRVILCHVSGERMKWQGSDGLSRGNLLEGVMTGEDMLTYVPLHKNALSRSPTLLPWIKSWAQVSDEEFISLSPTEWYTRGHDMEGGEMNIDGVWTPGYKSGCYLWSPPPAAAETACEEIRKARLKRTTSTHIFVCPRLLSPYWRQHIHRSADLIFEIPAGGEYWPKENFEPLMLAIYFPFISCRPWQLKRAPAIVELEDRLQKMWRARDFTQGTILRKLRLQTRRLANLPESVVFQMLHSFQSFGVPSPRSGKRDRSSMEKDEGPGQVHGG